MHKKLASELKSLAHDILRLKKDEDVFAIKAKASDLNDKLAVLVYIEEYTATSPQATETKEELISTFENNIAKIEEGKQPVVVDLFSEDLGKINDFHVEEKNTVHDKSLIVTDTLVQLEGVSDSLNEVDKLELIKESSKTELENSNDEFLTEELSRDLYVEKIKNDDNPLDLSDVQLLGEETSSSFAAEEEDKESLNEVFLSVTPKLSVNSIELVDEQILVSDSSFVKYNLDASDDIDEIKDSSRYSKYVHNFNEQTLKSVDLDVPPSLNIEKDNVAKNKDNFNEVKKNTLEDELQDTISVDVMTDLFTKKIEPQTSLNDRLSINQNIRIGLNDRIAFVNNLFNQNQTDFNRVLRELNVLNSFEESVKYVRYNVKSIYDWLGKEDYEDRFMEIIKRRFE